jgi:hypothetical protein
MNARRGLWLGVAVLALLVIAAGRWLSRDETGATVTVADTAPAAPALASTRAPALPPTTDVTALPPPPPLAGSDTPLPALPEPTADAAQTMRRAQLQGDPQAPAVARDNAGEAATAAELADPEAYQRYETRQTQRLYKQYVAAADSEIARLEQDIARARAEGLSPEQIDEGVRKLAAIRAMQDRLRAEGGGAH